MYVQLHSVILKKASVEEEKFSHIFHTIIIIFFPYKRLRRSTSFISQGTGVTIVTEYVLMNKLNLNGSQFWL